MMNTSLLALLWSCSLFALMSSRADGGCDRPVKIRLIPDIHTVSAIKTYVHKTVSESPNTLVWTESLREEGLSRRIDSEELKFLLVVAIGAYDSETLLLLQQNNRFHLPWLAKDLPLDSAKKVLGQLFYGMHNFFHGIVHAGISVEELEGDEQAKVLLEDILGIVSVNHPSRAQQFVDYLQQERRHFRKIHQLIQEAARVAFARLLRKPEIAKALSPQETNHLSDLIRESPEIVVAELQAKRNALINRNFQELLCRNLHGSCQDVIVYMGKAHISHIYRDVLVPHFSQSIFQGTIQVELDEQPYQIAQRQKSSLDDIHAFEHLIRSQDPSLPLGQREALLLSAVHLDASESLIWSELILFYLNSKQVAKAQTTVNTVPESLQRSWYFQLALIIQALTADQSSTADASIKNFIAQNIHHLSGNFLEELNLSESMRRQAKARLDQAFSRQP